MKRIVEIPVKHKSILIDADDLLRVRKHIWSIKNGGHTYYPFIQQKGKLITLGRFILDAKEDQMVDHIDGNGMNNRRENLRFVSPQQNMWNRRSSRSSTSKFKGVCWNKQDKCWRATIRANGKYEHLGSFENEIDAARVYENRARQIQRNFFKKEKSRFLRVAEPVSWTIHIQKKQRVSRFRGLRWHKRDKVWRVAIRVNGKRIEVGSFRLEIDAARAYDDATRKYHGSKAILNFRPKFLIKRDATSISITS